MRCVRQQGVSTANQTRVKQRKVMDKLNLLFANGDKDGTKKGQFSISDFFLLNYNGTVSTGF